MKAQDFVYCPRCGAEYNRFGPGHKCDPKILKQLEADKKTDQEVRKNQK